MLRLGKRTTSDERLARAYAIPPLVPPLYDVADEEDLDERQVYIPRMGKELKPEDVRFVPPLPRLGKLLDDYMREYRRELNDESARQVFAKIPRVGRSRRSVGEQEPQAGPLPRMGYRDADFTAEERRAAPLPRLGLAARAAPLPRLGLFTRAAPLPRLGLFTRAAPLPRLGLRQEDGENDDDNDIYWKDDNDNDNESDDVITNEMRAAPLPRLGLIDKKAVGMLRMGRDSSSDDTKRAMSMLRMGKRALSMLRMGKRPVRMLRMGRAAERRALGMLRMGKRDSTEESKRAMSMLRMGRSSNPEGDETGMQRDARAVSMLRMGRSMRMLRMGKRPVSMLRMGKRPVRMLRMGKRSTEESTDDSLLKKETVASGDSN